MERWIIYFKNTKMINFITKKHYDKKCLEDKYFINRWNYYNDAIELAKSLSPQSVLELGCSSFPLCLNSTRIDSEHNSEINYVFDCTKTPWDFKERFDLLICLQTFEHFKNKQTEVFNQIKKIVNKAIISVPYKWNKPNNCHHNIDENTLLKWFEIKPTFEKISIDSNRKRLICLYEFF
jgi:hypothetical protein